MQPVPAIGASAPDARSVLSTVAWRRDVFALYQQVREAPDPRAAHDLWRRGRDDLFASSPASPLLAQDAAGFDGLPVADYDPAWRFRVAVEPAEPASLDVPTGTDGIVTLSRIGLVRLPDLGALDVWRHVGYGGGIFLPIKDATAGADGGTYGGGRYLLDTIKGADLGGGDGELVLDLNFAYNPSCAYDPDWACPLAPPGNVLRAEIPVGELYRPSC